MKKQYFSSLLPELSIRAARATISRLGFSNRALRAYLHELFSRDFGNSGSFLGDPAFEATFGWVTAAQTMASLSPVLLSPRLVEAMDKPMGSEASDYRFSRDIAPYQHQLEAWEWLTREEPHSVVVTSGTGSGKTECFMVPILNSLVQEYGVSHTKLVGVRALFLYPLNALIQSQRERLHAWTAGLGDGVRFCLYNGLTQEREPQRARDETPNQVIDREILRASPPPIRDVFSKARDILICKADCEAACQHCLLDFDTRFRQDDLDRKAVLEFLTERWLDEFRLKDEYAQFGPSTRVEFQTLPEAITRELAHAGVEELRLFLVGDPSDWDIAASPLRSWVQKWAAGTGAVRLVLPPKAIDGLSQQDRFALSVLSNLEGISIWTGEAPPCLAGGQSIAELVVAGRAPLAWAYRSPTSPNSQWAIGADFLVRGQPKTAGKLLQQVSIAVNVPADIKGKVHRFEIGSEIDGTSEGFGRRLLARLEDDLGGKLIGGEGEIIRVSYQDRYLNAPLPVALLLDFISTLKMEYKDHWSVQAIELMVSPFQEQSGFSRPIYVYHNWPTVTDRELAIQAAFNYCGMDANLRSIDKRDAIHARLLEIERDDGNTLKIWLDQGFSFWQAQSPYRQDLRFPFVKGAAEQGQMIAKARMDLAGQSFPTYLFVER